MGRRVATAGRLRLPGAAGLVALLIGGVGQSLAVPAVAATVSGAYTVVSVNSNATAPAVPTIVVERDATSRLITVRVPPGTPVLRRFGGASDLTELSAGDRVVITGSGPRGSTIVAGKVQDTSVQMAGTQINGVVRYISRDFSRMSVNVTANEGAKAAFAVGSTVLVAITPSTPVLYIIAPGAGSNGVQGLRPGVAITFFGLSDREGRVVLGPHDIKQIQSFQEDALIRTAPGDGEPR